MLYLREQVEEFAWNKWGSAEKLDEEFERRDNEKKQKKEKKHKEKMAGGFFWRALVVICVRADVLSFTFTRTAEKDTNIGLDQERSQARPQICGGGRRWQREQDRNLQRMWTRTGGRGALNDVLGLLDENKVEKLCGTRKKL